ncbi:serine/threonine-protein kinase [Chitinilyticum piscinae]|uniref:non-specific serine/threonine protein kinase n=1 Tax=Chitinilyticum piscinae TaxID=2866724 RepID=A0A8J7G0A0_9NEIS|nr:serine/threonine-protein kinase [Chitinilyticum piscinae]MBE9608978.1 serine/threonine protein kinase [Chitinilyticum piscinae]
MVSGRLTERGSKVALAGLLLLVWGGLSMPQPDWGLYAGLAAFVLVLLLQLLAPLFGRGVLALLRVSALLLMLLAGGLSAFLGQFWLPWPALALLLGGILLQRSYEAVAAQVTALTADPLQDATSLREQGRYDEARVLLAGLSPEPGVVAELLLLAKGYESRGERDKAEQVYQQLGRRKTGVVAKPLASPAPAPGSVRGGGADEPRQLGRYRLEGELGKGAMGLVYRGLDQAIGRPVAIKTMALAEEFDDDQLAEARERFFREAETAGRLTHPNIVTVFDVGETDGLAYIAMELLAGATLDDHAGPDRLLPLEETLQIVRQVALALEYAHKQQVVHRDIKPANVMYDPASRKVKVTDFGIARLTDSSRTKTGVVLGTPSFMSPEQLAGQRVDGRSDLYSLGVLLYQLVSGYLPFNGGSLAELMYAIANLLPTDPRHYRPELPNLLVAIIMRALQKDPAQRFQSGAQFALALARLEAQLKGKANVQSRPGA